MSNFLASCGLALAFLCLGNVGHSRTKPAPPPSRFNYYLKIDPNSLPPGVKVVPNDKEFPEFFHISNASEVPLLVNEYYSNGVLAGGAKLVSGKVYFYFPQGIPMEGKEHLKGWQKLFEELDSTRISLSNEPAQVYENRKEGVAEELPKPQPFSINAKYGDKAHPIRGTIYYRLNPEYKGYYEKNK